MLYRKVLPFQRITYKRKDNNLKGKLIDLFNNVPSEFKRQYFEKYDVSEVVNKLYDSRNYYTHGDAKSKYKNLVIDYSEMHILQQLCQEVLRYYIFNELGLKYDEKD